MVARVCFVTPPRISELNYIYLHEFFFFTANQLNSFFFNANYCCNNFVCFCLNDQPCNRHAFSPSFSLCTFLYMCKYSWDIFKLILISCTIYSFIYEDEGIYLFIFFSLVWFFIQVTFSAINCWHSKGECRRKYKIYEFPLIVVYVRKVGSHFLLIPYAGPLSSHHLVRFIRNVLHPYAYIATKKEFLDVLARYQVCFVFLSLLFIFLYLSSYHSLFLSLLCFCSLLSLSYYSFSIH